MNGTRVKQVATTKSQSTQLELPHRKTVNQKIASGIGAMQRVRHLVPQATLYLIYQALIQPHFDYCGTFWGTWGVTLQEKLQKLHNRAACVLTLSYYDVDAGQYRYSNTDVTFLLIFMFANHGTKETIVSTANSVVVGIFRITMGDVTRNITIVGNHGVEKSWSPAKQLKLFLK